MINERQRALLLIYGLCGIGAVFTTIHMIYSGRFDTTSQAIIASGKASIFTVVVLCSLWFFGKCESRYVKSKSEE